MLDKLIELLGENEDIFFEERKFLEDRDAPFIIEPQDERRNENELKIQKTVSVINREIPKEETKISQQSLID